MRSVLLLILMSLTGALLWAGICALVVVPQKIRAKNWNMEYDPRSTIAKFAVLGILGQVIVWNFLFLPLLGSASYSRLCAANSNAKMVCNIACTYQADHPDRKLQTMAGCASDHVSPDSLDDYMCRMMPTNTRYYYAVVIGANGKPEAAYWSRNPLDVSDLHGTTREEVLHIMRNPFADENSIVGEFPSRN